MRLIDADKLIEHLKKFYDDCDIEDMLEFVRVSNFINNQPTAYDVDKVVEQLEEMRFKSNLFMVKNMNDTLLYGSASNRAFAYDTAIDIVKAGGIDEKSL